LFYDGRKTSPSAELASVVILKGIIPKYDSSGNISPTGRTYKYKIVDESTGEIIEELVAKKKDDLAEELEKYPLIRAKLIEILKGELEDEPTYASTQPDSEMSDEEFEEKLANGELDDSIINDAEEWGEI